MRSRLQFFYIRIGHKRVSPRGYMRVEIKYNDETLFFESDKPLSISMILKNLEIPSSTVLAVYDDTIVPHSSVISEDISIELIVVSSGG